MLPTISTLIRATTCFRSALNENIKKNEFPASVERWTTMRDCCDSLLGVFSEHNGSDELKGDQLKAIWDELSEYQEMVLLAAVQNYHKISEEDLKYNIQRCELARAAETALTIMKEFR